MKRSVFLLLDRYPDRGESYRSTHRFVLEHAELAERLGYDALWLTEHHYKQLGAPNPAVLLAAVAARTQRLRLGPAVSVLPYHSPVHVAEDYAAVDVLSGGRLNMGVGSGSQRVEFDALAVDFDSRRETFDSRLAELRRLWAGGELNIAPQQQVPPFYVATSSPDGARRIGERGDSVLALLGPGTAELDGLSRLIDSHREGLAKGGHPMESAEVVLAQFALVADTDEEAAGVAAAALGRTIDLLGGSGDGAERNGRPDAASRDGRIRLARARTLDRA